MGTEMELKNKVALVTGGSSGIGAETAEILSKNGCKVVVGYNRGEQRAKNLIKKLYNNGHNIVKIDLRDQNCSDVAKKFIKKTYGKLDYLINSAGHTEPINHADISSLTPEKFNMIISTNTGGTYSIIRTFVPLLNLSKSATIVNVSSVSAFTGSGSNIAYCAAKAAIDTMTISLARALGPKIRLLSVSPAAVATNFVEGRTLENLKNIAKKTPLNKVIKPKDVSLAILACLTHLKSSTGTKIIVDGGHHIK